MSKRTPHEPPIAWDRLNELIEALQSGAELTREMRAEIAEALRCLYVTFMLEHGTPGRRRRILLDLAAHIMHLLVEDHSASVKAAAYAVMPLGDKKKVEALQRRYRKMERSEWELAVWQIDPDLLDLVARAAARLPKIRKKRK